MIVHIAEFLRSYGEMTEIQSFPSSFNALEHRNIVHGLMTIDTAVISFITLAPEIINNKNKKLRTHFHEIKDGPISFQEYNLCDFLEKISGKYRY